MKLVKLNSGPDVFVIQNKIFGEEQNASPTYALLFYPLLADHAYHKGDYLLQMTSIPIATLIGVRFFTHTIRLHHGTHSVFGILVVMPFSVFPAIEKRTVFLVVCVVGGCFWLPQVQFLTVHSDGVICLSPALHQPSPYTNRFCSQDIHHRMCSPENVCYQRHIHQVVSPVHF